MPDIWAAVVLTAGTALLAGKRQFQRRSRREHHTRVAARRLHREAVANLTQLEDRNRLLQNLAEKPSDGLAPAGSGSMFGIDMIGDFHRLVIAELRTWVDEAAEELDRSRGRHLKARRVALRRLRKDIEVLCTEIEDREALWAEVAQQLMPLPSEEPEGQSGHVHGNQIADADFASSRDPLA